MRNDRLEGQVHRFCWVDLATTDQGAARSFYRQLFGWTVRDERAGEGQFGTFAHRDAPIASLYQLTRKQIEHGVPSHWTPYVCVPDVDATASTRLRPRRAGYRPAPTTSQGSRASA